VGTVECVDDGVAVVDDVAWLIDEWDGVAGDDIW